MSDPRGKEKRLAQKAAQIAEADQFMRTLAEAGVEFRGWPKLSRLNRDIIITEKLDGTNAAVGITDSGLVYAQSRNRLLHPHTDNMGFAAWVKQNEDVLRETLGPGLHFGEWWGQGIARKYGLTEKRFSLFNTLQWNTTESLLKLSIAQAKGVAIGVVPVLYEGPWETDEVHPAQGREWVNQWREVMNRLRDKGSVAAPGFMNPEGIVIFHKHSGTMFKVTLENDAEYKGGKRDQDNNMIEGQ